MEWKRVQVYDDGNMKYAKRSVTRGHIASMSLELP